MTSINPVETSVQNPAFKGLAKGLKAIAEHKKEIKQLGERVDKQGAIMEKIAGLTYATQIKDPTVLKEVILRETAQGNLDFVNGILSSNAAKNIYKK